MIPRPLRLSALAVTVTVTMIASGCGSDAESSETVDTAASATDQAADVTTQNAASDGSSPTLAGATICERLTVDSVAADVGLDVTSAAADDTGTPQCAYEYINDSGATSNLTVAAMRPEDVGGLSGADAYEFVVEVNRRVAGDDVDEQEIDAGDGAIRISGPSLHLGVLRVGDHVYTLIVPADDAEVDAVDHLIGTMATTLG